MARIRSVHPEICIDKGLADLDARYERTFVRLWTYCDDEGRCIADGRLIKAAIYPRDDRMTPDEVDHDIDVLAEAGFVVRYHVDGEDYLCIRSFNRWQKPQHPAKSKLPTPPERPGGRPETKCDPHESSGESHEAYGEALHGEGVGVGGGVVEGELLASTVVVAAVENPIDPPDPLRCAVMAVCGLDEARLTSVSLAVLNKALKDLRQVGAQDEQVWAAAEAYRAKFPRATLTASALAKHWPQLASADPPKLNDVRPDRADLDGDVIRLAQAMARLPVGEDYVLGQAFQEFEDEGIAERVVELWREHLVTS